MTPIKNTIATLVTTDCWRRRCIVTALCCTVSFAGCAPKARPCCGRMYTKQADTEYSADKPFIIDITPEQASNMLDGGGFVYLDVRTLGEFERGHPQEAMNIPLLERQETTGRMAKNTKFLDVVQANIPVDASLIVGCKSGGRSAAASKLLQQAGYHRLWNMLGGYEGVISPTGKVTRKGWLTYGYPIERGDGGDKSYRALSTNSERQPGPVAERTGLSPGVRTESR